MTNEEAVSALILMRDNCLRKLLEMVSDVNEQIRQLRGSGKQTGEIADWEGFWYTV